MPPADDLPDTPTPQDPRPEDSWPEELYRELRERAERAFRGQRGDHTLSPTALVHEAYLKMEASAGAGEKRWEGRGHFLAVASTAMRQILVNHARDRRAQKRGAGAGHRVTLDRVLDALATDSVDALMLEEALQKLARLSERQARVVELRIFGGLNIDEVADHLEVGRTTVKTDWNFARAWLKRELGEAGRP